MQLISFFLLINDLIYKHFFVQLLHFASPFQMQILICKAIFKLLLMLLNKFLCLIFDFSFTIVVFALTLFVKCGTFFVHLI
jgi:hypothetical protein